MTVSPDIEALKLKRLTKLMRHWAQIRRGASLLAKYHEQNGKCYLCGESLLDWRRGRPNKDHKIPVSKGGTSAMTNIGLAHLKCNSGRGNSDLPHDLPVLRDTRI